MGIAELLEEHPFAILVWCVGDSVSREVIELEEVREMFIAT